MFEHVFREIKANDAIPLLQKIDRKMSSTATEIEDGLILVSNRRGGIEIEDKRSKRMLASVCLVTATTTA
jgi:hypothetical protein